MANHGHTILQCREMYKKRIGKNPNYKWDKEFDYEKYEKKSRKKD